MRLRTPTLLVSCLAASLLAVSCSGSNATTTAASPSTAAPAPAPAASTGPGTSAPSASTAVFPDPDWKTVDPATKHIAPAAMTAYADSLNTGASTCTLTLKDGEIVQEQYWNGTTQDTRQE